MTMTAQELYLQRTAIRDTAINIIKQYTRTKPHVFNIPLTIHVLSPTDGICLMYFVQGITSSYISILENKHDVNRIPINKFNTDNLCAIAAYLEQELGKLTK